MPRVFASTLIHLASAAIVVMTCPATALAYGEHRPVCSDSGAQMVFMRQSERTADDWELYRLDFPSGVTARLTYHPGWDGYAAWSPDGTAIVFDRGEPPDGPKSPWIMDLETSEATPLGEYEGWLSISDWGAQDILLGFHEMGGQRDLVLVNPSGEITRRLTDTPGASEHDAHFSPGGDRIAFASGPLGDGDTSLEIIDLASGERRVLRTSQGRIYGLGWSPDGALLAFVDAPGGEDDDADIFIYDFEEGHVRQITDDPSWDHMPQFCGDRHDLVFTSYRSGEERIYRLDPEPRPLLIREPAN